METSLVHGDDADPRSFANQAAGAAGSPAPACVVTLTAVDAEVDDLLLISGRKVTVAD